MRITDAKMLEYDLYLVQVDFNEWLDEPVSWEQIATDDLVLVHHTKYTQSMDKEEFEQWCMTGQDLTEIGGVLDVEQPWEGTIDGISTRE